ncbi:laccase [Punctularia strigosozonata HHB-11173 SS5]|uniref:laccase n=1 Tax=Punctularia strigosozonata (strain HHB-11173) TaxID=741275 RepID=UPI0004416417|nr:laccase [Punctularia strigosozonata HHB-11173 SS5]EIN06348.1 laccase [Punctularia strigosozonata HHB-11173 SS5]
MECSQKSPLKELATTLLILFSMLNAGGSSLPPKTNLPIVNRFIAPDGFNRSTVLAGGVFPGPLIAANKGDEFAINVQDQLHDPTMNQTTSIHWHGIQQRGGTNWADGPAFVTQCPIAPGHSFLYRFNSFDQTGTYWYHSHETLQYCDGLRGPLVIYNPDDPQKHLYDVDDESTIITLADWYHQVSLQVQGPFNESSTLINGKGRFAGGPNVDLAVINVENGKRYRFRLVSISCEPAYNFSINSHSMTVIEADGNSVNPVTVGSLQIFPGQRYSFVLTANQPVDNYWIRAQPNVAMDSSFNNGLNSAILRYAGANNAEPTQAHPSPGIPLLETNLHPTQNPAAPQNSHGEADVVINLNFLFNATSGHFTVNGASFLPVRPFVPVLLQILSGAKTAQQLLPPGSVMPLPRNKVIQVSMPGKNVFAAGGPHPLHLHGHAFSVIRSAGSNVTNIMNPVRRDVVSIGDDSDDVLIRFTTDNPGPWILHCHIDDHLNRGFAVVFAEDIPDIPKVDQVPQSWKELCPIYDALPDSQL